MNTIQTQGLIRSKRHFLLMSVSLVAIVAMFFVAPIAQDLSYHQFADQQTLFSIPHFWNVVSNLPFIWVGLIGLTVLRKKNNNALTGMLPELRMAYITFFIGVFLTGFGSSYYHWNPINATLLWDRLPMTISFMAFFTVIIGENISIPLAKILFYPLVFLGIVSAVYWIVTESNGAGDLRPYALVQFLPVLLIPLILWLYPSPFNGQRYIVYVIGAYVVAKLMEHFDHQIFEVLGMMSGHAIKHVVAAVGTYYFYLALKRRRKIVNGI